MQDRIQAQQRNEATCYLNLPMGLEGVVLVQSPAACMRAAASLTTAAVLGVDAEWRPVLDDTIRVPTILQVSSGPSIRLGESSLYLFASPNSKAGYNLELWAPHADSPASSSCPN